MLVGDINMSKKSDAFMKMIASGSLKKAVGPTDKVASKMSNKKELNLKKK